MFHKDCKKYPCDWCYSVKGCPKECQHFKHKDEVMVIRCKDCKHQITKGYAQYRYRWCEVWKGINGMGDDGFCNYAERRTEDGK